MLQKTFYEFVDRTFLSKSQKREAQHPKDYLENEKDIAEVFRRQLANCGLGKIYTEQEIERARQSPAFKRKYNLKYLGKIGNAFSLQKIEQCINLGELYKSIIAN